MIATSSPVREENNPPHCVSSFGFGGTNSTSFSKKRLRPMPLRRPQAVAPPAAFATLCQDSGSPRGIQHALRSILRPPLRKFLPTLPTPSNRTQADGAPAFRGRRRFQRSAKLLLQPNPLRCSTKRCERAILPSFSSSESGTQYVTWQTYIATSPFSRRRRRLLRIP